MIKIYASVFRNWQRPWIIKISKEAETFIIKHNCTYAELKEGEFAGLELVMFLESKKVNCHYKDYMGPPFGWRINKKQFSRPTKVSQDMFRERIRKKFPNYSVV